MTIEWLAGNKLRGTTAERPNFGLPSGSVGGWVEVGRTTLGSTSSSIDVSSLTDKRYYMILSDKKFTGLDGGTVVRYNSDSGSNYSERFNNNGGSDSTYNSIAHHTWGTANTASGQTQFTVGYVSNLSSKEKLALSHSTDTNGSGAGSAPDRTEAVGKWANTSSVISAFSDRAYGGSSVIESGSEVVVLGWDPSDSHTTNFWEQIGTASGTGLTDITLDSSKKYNWLQAHFTTTSSSAIDLQLGNTSLDAGNNYSHRRSTNGGADATVTGDNGISFASGWTSSYRMFLNAFIINNSANEKLVIANIVYTLAGASNAPARYEIVGKWANTSSQFNHIGIVNDASSLIASSEAKVWGSD